MKEIYIEWEIKFQDNIGNNYINWVISPTLEEAINFFRSYTKVSKSLYTIISIERLHRVYKPTYKTTTKEIEKNQYETHS